MELKALFTLYRHWIWLLVAGLVLGLASGFLVSRLQTPIYEATAKVLVTRTRPQSGTDILALSDQQLVLTYLDLLKTPAVLNTAGGRIGATIDPRDVIAEVVANTQIIQIKIHDKNAGQAAAIANQLVQVLIEQNETLQAGRYASYEDGLNSQIAQVQAQIGTLQGQITNINQTNIQDQLAQVDGQISALQDQIRTLEQDIAKSPDSLSTTARAELAQTQGQLEQLRSLLYLYQQIKTNLVYIGKPAQGSGPDDPRITSLQATLTLYQQLYLNLLNNLEAVKLARAQSTPTVTKIQDASTPRKPIWPIPWLYTAVSAMVGLLIAAGAVLLIDYSDDTLRSSQRVREILDLPVLAEIVQYNEPDRMGGSSAENPAASAFLNGFGILRINVGRALAQKSDKSVLITSATLGEGKTTIAINLAAAFARAGRKVVLVDTDLYKPVLHSRLGLDNRNGLTDLLADDISWRELAKNCDGVSVITSGENPQASFALLESDRMAQLLQDLEADADIIILDGPPLFIVDSHALSSMVGGVVLVLRQGKTTSADGRGMLEQLKLIDVKALGVVLNRVQPSNSYYAAGYYRDDQHKKAEDGGNAAPG